MIQHRVNFSICLMVVAVSTACSVSCAAQTYTRMENIDIDSDGKIDIVKYYNGDILQKQESPVYNNEIFNKEIIEWKDRGSIESITTLPKNPDEKRFRELYKHPYTMYFKPATLVNIEGKEYNLQEADLNRTYGKKSIDGTSYFYSQNQKIDFTKVVYKNKSIASIVFYDEHGQPKKIFENFNREHYFGILTTYNKTHQPQIKKIHISTHTPISELVNYQP